ncbi:MAG: PKD domain-containing protein [Methanobacteriota archaeon]|nr:MAG: PKD domain-containing protein [Euryarchaeota archaeon]
MSERGVSLIAYREGVLVAAILSLMVLPVSSPSFAASTAEDHVQYMYSGNQETLADPMRPLVYYGEGSWIYVVDAGTGATLDAISVDGQAESLDLSRDSNSLYVALAQTNKIAVIDLLTRNVRREIPLNFTPLSVRAGRPDRLYVSNAPGEGEFGHAYVINESSGFVVRDLYISFAAALEVDPSASVLLTAWLFVSPGEITRYDITTDNVTQIGPSYYGPYYGRQSVDWVRNRMYVGSAIISLETMTVIEPIYLSSVLFSAAFASNGTRIYGIVGSFYGPGRSLWGRDSVTGWETTAPQADGTGWVVVSEDGANLIVGKPLQRVTRPITLTPSYPRPNAVLNATPGWVSARLDFGLPFKTLSNAVISLDGARLPLHVFVPEDLEGLLNSSLPDGKHTVDYALTFAEGESVGAAWEFWIYVNMTTPSVGALYPAQDSIEKAAVSYLQASINHGDPWQPIESVSMYLDGRSLETSFESPEVLRAALPVTLQDGDYQVWGEISWNGGVRSFYWRFSVRIEIPPLASFAVGTQALFVGDEITFDASSSSDLQGTIVVYRWDFGDGEQEQGRVVSHIFSKSGSFVVRLRVVDNRGLEGASAMEVTLEMRPPGPFPVWAVLLASMSMTAAVGFAISGVRNESERKSRLSAPPRSSGTAVGHGRVLFCIFCGAPTAHGNRYCFECGRPVWAAP